MATHAPTCPVCAHGLLTPPAGKLFKRSSSGFLFPRPQALGRLEQTNILTRRQQHFAVHALSRSANNSLLRVDPNQQLPIMHTPTIIPWLLGLLLPAVALAKHPLITKYSSTETVTITGPATTMTRTVWATGSHEGNLGQHVVGGDDHQPQEPGSFL